MARGWASIRFGQGFEHVKGLENFNFKVIISDDWAEMPHELECVGELIFNNGDFNYQRDVG